MTLLHLVEDFGADPTGTSDSSSAIASAGASGTGVWVDPGTYLANNVIWHTANKSRVSGLPGTVTIRKNADGPILTIKGAQDCGLFGINFDGNGAQFAGVGLSLPSSLDFRWSHGDIAHTASYCVEWPTSNSGGREAFFFGKFFVEGKGLPAFHFPPADTISNDRMLSHIFCQGGDLADFNGCETVLVSCCDMANFFMGQASHKVTMNGCRIATGGMDTNILGVNHTIVGNTHAGRFVIAATCVNSRVGPNTTVKPSVNNSPSCVLL